MNRRLKALGLALFAAFALSAIGASAASADIFKSDAENTIVTSNEQHVKHEFHAFGQTIECEVANFSGTQSGAAAEEITITPTYDKCKTTSGIDVEVRTNHCGFLFTSTTVPDEEHLDAEEKPETHAPVHVECTGRGEEEKEEEHIEIELPSLGHCNMTVENGVTTRGVTYKNLEDGTVTVDLTAGIEVHRDPGSFLCNILPTEDTGEYTGASILTGYEDSGTPTTGNGITFVEDETATTDEVGNTHWDWSEGESENPVDIEVEST